MLNDPDKIISFKKIAEPYGWFSNMSQHGLKFEGKHYKSAEALFQSLRFNNVVIKEHLRLKKSPIQAKMFSKLHHDKMVIEQLGEQDVSNMRMVLKLKLQYNPKLIEMLRETGDKTIVEDCTNREFKGSLSTLFWGAVLHGDEWFGENTLGKLWMELREQLPPATQQLEIF